MALRRFRDWSIKYKLLLSHSLTAFIPAVFFLILFVVIVQNNLSSIEKKYAYQELEQAYNLLREKENDLRYLTVDYALWDDTYDYIRSPNEDYETENLDWLHESQGGDLVIFADREGRVIAERGGFDEFTAGTDLTSTLLWQSVYGEQADSYVCVGLIATSQGPFRVGASQIFRSDGSGLPEGLFVIGESLRKNRATEIESILGAHASFEPILEDSSVVSAELTLLDADHLRVRDTLYTIDGTPLVNLDLIIDREIFHGIERDLMIIYLAMLAMALIIVPVLSAVLSSSLRRRISKLRDLVYRLSSTERYTARIEIMEKDELGGLAQSFNVMLEDLQKTQSDLKGRNSWLRRLIQQKERLMMILSHEIRSPLSGVAPLLNFLGEREVLSEESRENLRIIQKESERICRVIGDILETNRLEEGNLSFAKRPHSLELLLSESLAVFSSRAKQAGVALVRDEPTEVWILTDQERFQQVMINLISNSLRHTSKGGSITISTEEPAESPNRVRITVSDTGSGMEPDILARVFDGSLRLLHLEEPQEFGLGLVIAKLIVEQNEGRIWAESQARRGTKIHFEMPKTEPLNDSKKH